MIIDEFVNINIGANNVAYWRSKGYEINFKVGGKNAANKRDSITVRVTDLQPKSNLYVNCKCDLCGEHFTRKFSNHTDICYPCYCRNRMLGNTHGTANKGKPNYKQRGENHPRWNPNKSEFRKYRHKVGWLSEKAYVLNKDEINPNGYPRTLAGIEGGYQLDHIKSVKECYLEGIDPEIAACVTNLQMLPWLENLTKHAKTK